MWVLNIMLVVTAARKWTVAWWGTQESNLAGLPRAPEQFSHVLRWVVLPPHFPLSPKLLVETSGRVVGPNSPAVYNYPSPLIPDQVAMVEVPHVHSLR